MCATCGCNNHKHLTFSLGTHEHVHADGTRHAHRHAHGPVAPGGLRYIPVGGDGATVAPVPRAPAHEHDLTVPGRDAHVVALEADILGKNAEIAERNRSWLAERNILALNLVSSPGAGKTTLLERTINDVKARAKLSVIEGDQATSNDAERIRATGVPAVQINTGTGCHLEADMLERALALLKPAAGSIVLVENVGNLVCPALFDLGERAKVVIFSVTEGEDKPLKYPHMFRAAKALVLTKTDLLPYLRFDVARALANARSVNPQLEVFEVSAYSGEGLARWYSWLEAELTAARAEHAGLGERSK